MLNRYPLDFYTRPCKAATYTWRNGTQAQCEAFTFTGRRQLSDCLGEATHFNFTWQVGQRGALYGSGCPPCRCRQSHCGLLGVLLPLLL